MNGKFVRTIGTGLSANSHWNPQEEGGGIPHIAHLLAYAVLTGHSRRRFKPWNPLAFAGLAANEYNPTVHIHQDALQSEYAFVEHKQIRVTYLKPTNMLSV